MSLGSFSERASQQTHLVNRLRIGELEKLRGMKDWQIEAELQDNPELIDYTVAQVKRAIAVVENDR